MAELSAKSVSSCESWEARPSNGEGAASASPSFEADATKSALRANLSEPGNRDVFRQLVENIREVFWVSNIPKNHVVYISPGYESIWGRTCASLYASPKDWLEAVHPEDRERVQTAAFSKQASGQYNETYRILRPDGEVRWIHDRAFVVQNENGVADRVVGVAEDITTRKLAEDALREAEANYRGLFENAVEGIFQTTPEGRYLSANPALARMLGSASPEKLIASITDLGHQLCVHPETRPALLKRLETENFVRGFENEIYRKDRSKIWVSVNMRTVRDASGKILYYQGTSQDITKRKEMEEKLLMLGHAVQSTTEPISITDLENRFTFVNRAFEAAHGYSEAEILGKTPEILHSPRNSPQVMSEILRGTRNGGWRGELLDLRKDGTEFPVHLSTSVIKDQSGRAIGLMGVAQDITAQKGKEKQDLAFLRVGQRLNLATTPGQAAEIIFRTACELFACDAGTAYVYCPKQGGMLRVLTADGANHCGSLSEPSGLLREPSPLMRRAIKTGACLLTRPEEFAEAGDLVLQRRGNNAAGCAMVVPIHSGGELFGVFSIESDQAKAYNEADLIITQALADYCGGALQRIKMVDPLRESERKLRLIAENTTDVIFAFNMQRQLLYVNHAIQDLTGYTFEEIQELGFINWIHPDDEARMLQHWEELYLGKSHSDVEFRLITKDGQQKWCSSTWGPLYDERGRQIGVQGRERNVTQHRLAEAARRQLAAIVENSQDAIFSCGLDGRMVSWNRAAERIYGFTAAEAIGKSVSILLLPDCAANLMGILDDVAGGKTLDNHEVIHRRKDGSTAPVSLTVSPVCEEGGKVTGASVIARDISQRMQLEKEVLESSMGERRRIGHELHDGLGQFLAGISLRAKALEQTLSQEGLPQRRDAAELTALLSNAISQTRSLARGLDPVEVENRGLIIALQDLAAETEKLFGVRCLFGCHVSEIQVNGQVGLAFYRIMQEAIHNAIKHGAAQRIQAELKFGDGYLCLEIQDDGAGFDTDAPGKGGGMGLRIMNYRARSIGAGFKVIGQPGQGVRIECRWPAQDTRTASPQ